MMLLSLSCLSSEHLFSLLTTKLDMKSCSDAKWCTFKHNERIFFAFSVCTPSKKLTFLHFRNFVGRQHQQKKLKIKIKKISFEPCALRSVPSHRLTNAQKLNKNCSKHFMFILCRCTFIHSFIRAILKCSKLHEKPTHG